MKVLFFPILSLLYPLSSNAGRENRIYEFWLHRGVRIVSVLVWYSVVGARHNLLLCSAPKEQDFFYLDAFPASFPSGSVLFFVAAHNHKKKKPFFWSKMKVAWTPAEH